MEAANFPVKAVFVIKKIRYNRKMLTEKDILQAIIDEKVGLPPLMVRLIRGQAKKQISASNKYLSPDAQVEVSWGRRRWNFLAEIKAAATPKAFANAIATVKPAAIKTKLNPMIVLPYLSPEKLAELEKLGISGLDLCGNGVVIVPGAVLVARTGEPNRFPRSEPIRNVYRGDSSFVGRVFLVKPRYQAVGEIVTTIREMGGSITIATVSKVLKTLEADLIVERSSNGIGLIQAEKLLDQLAANYRSPRLLERWVGKVEIGESELSKSLADGARSIDSRFIITGAASAVKYSVFAREPVVAAYCTVSPKKILSALAVNSEETDRFPNVDLIRTDDGLPYFDSIKQDSFEYASPVQAYLELMSGDKRQRETAVQVREYILRRLKDYKKTR